MTATAYGYRPTKLPTPDGTCQEKHCPKAADTDVRYFTTEGVGDSVKETERRRLKLCRGHAPKWPCTYEVLR